MIRAVFLFFALFAVWLLWSGLFKPLLIGLGLASCALAVFLAHRMETLDKESVPLHLGTGIITYWFWLLFEIVKSALEVTRVILSPGLPISPRVVRIQALPRGEVTRVILGNSITLTPRTEISPRELSLRTLSALVRPLLLLSARRTLRIRTERSSRSNG